MKRLQKILDYFLELGSKRTYKRYDFLRMLPLMIPALVIFLFFLILLTNWDSKVKWFKNITNPNKIEVISNGLNNNDIITIKWTLGDFYDTIIIYDDKTIKYNNFKNSGKNIFLLYLNDSLINKFEQDKDKFWKGYNYNFIIDKNKVGQVDSRLKIK